MESADGSAGDGDERKWKHLAGEDRPSAVDEASKSGHVQCGMYSNNPDAKKADGTEFHESAQVVARGEQQPDGHSGGGKGIDDDRYGKDRGRQREDLGWTWMERNPLATPDRKQHEGEAKRRYF